MFTNVLRSPVGNTSNNSVLNPQLGLDTERTTNSDGVFLNVYGDGTVSHSSTAGAGSILNSLSDDNEFLLDNNSQ